MRAYPRMPVSVRALFHVLAHLPHSAARLCVPVPCSHHPITATDEVINGHACSSSHVNAISKTNKNLLHGNLQIKVHFPLKEECAEREFHDFTAKEARDVAP